MIRKQHILILCLLIFILLLLTDDIFYDSYESNAGHVPQERVTSPHSINLTEKWIVITTIAYPTSAVIALAAEIGWRVVIVADTKTPKDWNHSNCDFISIERQKELGYSISHLIPFKSYTRKMIGYLYAIQNGAEWIYDTDDDNQPIGLGLKQFETTTKSSGISYGIETQRTERNLFNPYEFWGQPSIWPRGYPLENVKTENVEASFRLCKTSKTPVIQQGLVTKDPDVDALYRLLHADAKNGLDVTFNQHAPPVTLNTGTFCPFNSQNTFFHRDAFWSLFLPISVAFRVTDIWRGYYAQKLIHLIGQRIGFYPANAVQKRNSHSYLADFEDEAFLYSDAGRLVDFLTNWTCSFSTLPKCMIQLSSEFVKHKFWKATDLELTKAWIKDLESFNYIFPSVIQGRLTGVKNSNKTIDRHQSEDCRSAFLHFSNENSSERNNHFGSYREDLKDWCNEALPAERALSHRFDERINFTSGIWGKLRKIALIISGNYPFGPSISLMQRIYQPYFATVIFCGTIYHGNIAKTDGYPKLHRFSYINITEKEINAGYRAYICTAKAIELNLQNIDGFLTIADDLGYNFFNDFDFSRFRLTGTGRPRPFWWNSAHGTTAMNNTIQIIQNRTKLQPNSSLAKAMKLFAKAINGSDVYALLMEKNMVSASDFYYIPKENKTFFYELSSVFFETQLFHEIALPKIGAGLQWFRFYNTSELDIPTYIQLWGGDRNVWEKHYSKKIICLHPIKLSYVKDLKERSKYCDFIVRSYLDSISIAPIANRTNTSTTTTTITKPTTVTKSTITTTTTTTTTTTKITAATSRSTTLTNTFATTKVMTTSITALLTSKTPLKTSTKVDTTTSTSIHTTQSVIQAMNATHLNSTSFITSATLPKNITTI